MRTAAVSSLPAGTRSENVLASTPALLSSSSTRDLGFGALGQKVSGQKVSIAARSAFSQNIGSRITSPLSDPPSPTHTGKDASCSASSQPPLQMKGKRKGPSVQEILANKGRRARRKWLRQRRAERARAAEKVRNKADRAAWHASLAGTDALLPGGHDLELHQDTAGLRSLGADADTSFPRRDGIRVRYDPTIPSRRDMDKRTGLLAQTLTHELAVHGRNLGTKEADVEHREMHAPATRDTYLGASRRTFNQLANPKQKTSFANAWHADMSNQIRNSEVWDDARRREVRLPEAEKSRRRDWALQRRNSMIDAITNPADHPWTEEE